jgi:MFS family permease
MALETGNKSVGNHLSNTFAALHHRHYRVWFFGQLVSLLGAWMQATAQGFLIFELTHSAAFLGYVTFASGMPSWLFMLYGGVLADRISRRRLLIITQAAMMGLAIVLAALAWAGVVEPWHIVVLSLLLGVATAFDAPARQAMVLELVPRKDLTNALALNSMVFNLATATGPAAAGIIYAVAGPAWCFVINAISFVGVLWALLLIPDSPPSGRTRGSSVLAELKEGLAFSVRDPVVRPVLLLVIFTTVFGMAFSTLLPAWAVRILHGDATTNGFLQSARGIGALVGSLFLATVAHKVLRGRLLHRATLLLGLSLLALALLRSAAAATFIMAFVGVGVFASYNLCNSLIQTHTPDALRGRVLALYSLAFFGVIPLAGLAVGFAADRVGEPLTVGTCALVLLAFAIYLRLAHPQVARAR